MKSQRLPQIMILESCRVTRRVGRGLTGRSLCVFVVTGGQDGGAGRQWLLGCHLSAAADDGLRHRSPSHVHLW